MTTPTAKRTALILVLALAVVCIIVISCINISSAAKPVSLSFVGYTNEHGVTAAMFRLTNNCSAGIDFHVELTGFRLHPDGPGSPEPGAACSGSLRGHSAYYFPLLGVTGPNGWRYEAVFSATVPRPAWQQRLGFALDRVGVHVYLDEKDRVKVGIGGAVRGSFWSEKVYRSTNSWTSN